MAIPQRSSGGYRRVAGGAVRSESGVACCCGGAWRQGRLCSDTSTFGDVYAPAEPADPTFFARHSGDGRCYEFRTGDPSVTSIPPGGEALSAVGTVTACSNSVCRNCSACDSAGGIPASIQVTFVDSAACGICASVAEVGPNLTELWTGTLGTYTLTRSNVLACLWRTQVASPITFTDYGQNYCCEISACGDVPAPTPSGAGVIDITLLITDDGLGNSVINFDVVGTWSSTSWTLFTAEYTATGLTDCMFDGLELTNEIDGRCPAAVCDEELCAGEGSPMRKIPANGTLTPAGENNDLIGMGGSVVLTGSA